MKENEWFFEPQGECACGNVAYTVVYTLLAPGKNTEPEPKCDSCIEKEYQEKLDIADNNVS